MICFTKSFSGRLVEDAEGTGGFKTALLHSNGDGKCCCDLLLIGRTWTECDTLVDGHRLRIFNRWHGSQILALNQILAVKNGEFLSDLQVFELDFLFFFLLVEVHAIDAIALTT